MQISGKRKTTSGKMEDRENGKTPAQLKDELSGLKMRALQQALIGSTEFLLRLRLRITVRQLGVRSISES